MTFAENINRICAERGTNLTAVIKQIKNGQSSYTTAPNSANPNSVFFIKHTFGFVYKIENAD